MDFDQCASYETPNATLALCRDAHGLMRELLLGHLRPDDAVAAPVLAEQHLHDTPRQVREDQV